MRFIPEGDILTNVDLIEGSIMSVILITWYFHLMDQDLRYCTQNSVQSHQNPFSLAWMKDHREVYFVKKAYTTNMKTEFLQRKDFNNKSCKSCLKVRFSPIWHNKLFYHWTEFH